MTDFAALEEGKLQLKGKRDTIIQIFEKKYRIMKSGEKQPITTLYVTLQSFQYHQVTMMKKVICLEKPKMEDKTSFFLILGVPKFGEGEGGGQNPSISKYQFEGIP